MKRRTIALSISCATGVLALAGVTAAADTNFDGEDMDTVVTPISPPVVLRRLDNVSATLDRAHARLMRLIDSGPAGLPPDPCSDPRATSCKEVQSIEAIDSQAETFLAGVAVLDDGSDRAALARRLSYSTATFAWATTRLESLTSDWRATRSDSLPPSQLPPDPCAPAISANVDVLTLGAEFAERRTNSIDTCSESASIDRRLGYVATGLETAGKRLDAFAAVGFNPQPDPPGTPVLQEPPEPDKIDRELDAIIAQAEYVASTARALKSNEVPISGPQ